MKFVFSSLFIAFLSGPLFAQSAQEFTATAYITVEDDAEGILNEIAAGKCGKLKPIRESQIRSDYKPYRYYITVQADYRCE